MSIVIVQDSMRGIKQQCYFTAETTLKQLRGKIKIPAAYEDFTFLSTLDKELISVNVASEQNALVKSYIVEDKRLLIKFTLKQQKSQNQKANAKIKDISAKSAQNKKLVESWIKDLDDFDKKSYNNAKEKQKQAKEKLDLLRKQLDDHKIQFYLKSSINVQDAIDTLKKIALIEEDSIKVLKEAKILSNHELAGRFSNEICVGFYKEIQRDIQIIDVKNSEIFENQQLNDFKEHQFLYESQQHENTHTTQINKSYKNGSLSIMGGSPFCLLMGTSAYNKDWQRKHQNTTNNKYKTYFQTKKAYNICTGIKFTTDSIQVTDDFQKFFNMIYQEFYKQERGKKTPSEKFKRRAKEFFQKFGRQIQTGTYYLGNTYYNKVKCLFKQEQELESVKSMSLQALRISVAGGAIFQGGFIAATGSFNVSNQAALDKLVEKLSTHMSVDKVHVSHPSIQDLNKWKQVIQTANSFWKILVKQVKKVCIFQILKNPKNLKKLGLKERDIKEFEQFMLNCDRMLGHEYDNVIQLEIDDFHQITNAITRLTASQKQTRELHIKRLSSKCTNVFMELQLLIDEGCNQTLIKGKMKIMQPYKTLYLVRKTETIQSIYASTQLQSCDKLEQIINYSVGKVLFKKDSKKESIQMVRQPLSLECIDLKILVEALLVVSQQFCKLEKLIIYADIPVINSLAMREFARSLRKMPQLKLQVVVDKKCKAEETQPNWTHETVIKGEVIYQ